MLGSALLTGCMFLGSGDVVDTGLPAFLQPEEDDGNVFSDGGFEDDDDDQPGLPDWPWQLDPDDLAVFELVQVGTPLGGGATLEAVEGDRVLRVTGDPQRRVTFQQTAPIDEGGTYEISFWMYIAPDRPGPSDDLVEVEALAWRDREPGQKTSVGRGILLPPVIQPGSPGDWVQYVYEMNVDEDPQFMVLRVKISQCLDDLPFCDESDVVYFDDVFVQRLR